MRRNSIIATVVIAALLIISVIGVNQWTAEATCIDCTCPGGDVITGGLGAGGSCTVEGNDDDLYKQENWRFTYRTGMSHTGSSATVYGNCFGSSPSWGYCYPAFDSVEWTSDTEADIGYFTQYQHDRVSYDGTYCVNRSGFLYLHTLFDSNQCIPSPILVDVLGDGFALTNLANGVTFDMVGDGSGDPISWTASGSDDAWLALDRNGNGTIDWGQELFGTVTPQPIVPGERNNGFLALKVYDLNHDSRIDSNDAVFTDLRLWQDVNHNGISESYELRSLPELGVTGFELKFKEAKKTDKFGNRFAYRAKVNGANVSRWAWDVFLVQ